MCTIFPVQATAAHPRLLVQYDGLSCARSGSPVRQTHPQASHVVSAHIINPSPGWEPKNTQCATRRDRGSLQGLLDASAGARAWHTPCIRHLHGPRWCPVTALTKGLTRYLMGGREWAGRADEVLTLSQVLWQAPDVLAKAGCLHTPTLAHSHARTHSRGRRCARTHTHIAVDHGVPFYSAGPTVPTAWR